MGRTAPVQTSVRPVTKQTVITNTYVVGISAGPGSAQVIGTIIAVGTVLGHRALDTVFSSFITALRCTRRAGMYRTASAATAVCTVAVQTIITNTHVVGIYTSSGITCIVGTIL